MYDFRPIFQKLREGLSPHITWDEEEEGEEEVKSKVFLEQSEENQNSEECEMFKF